jgi:NTE family protein
MKYKDEINAYLQETTNYSTIIKPSQSEKMIARNVGTNLTSLRKIEVDCLIEQDEALTELQVKLYCPSLFKEFE